MSSPFVNDAQARMKKAVDHTLHEFSNIHTGKASPSMVEGIMVEALWSDPCDLNGRHPSKRGVGVMFGPDVAERFLADNGLSKYHAWFVVTFIVCSLVGAQS